MSGLDRVRERVYTVGAKGRGSFYFAHRAVWFCGTTGALSKQRANRKTTPFCVSGAVCRSWRSDTRLTTAHPREVNSG